MDGISYSTKHVPVGPPPVGDEPQKTKTVRVLKEVGNNKIRDHGRIEMETVESLESNRSPADSTRARYDMYNPIALFYSPAALDRRLRSLPSLHQ